ncbi:hypothetical protein [Xanthomonas citri]|nr:hypothetical protein [Xanthomonas citri]
MNAEIIHRLEASFPRIEEEIRARRMEESRRLLDESSAAFAERDACAERIRELSNLHQINDATKDPRTKQIHQRMLDAQQRADLLMALEEATQADLERLNPRAKDARLRPDDAHKDGG